MACFAPDVNGTGRILPPSWSRRSSGQSIGLIAPLIDIAVIIPCFNLGRFVAEAIETALRQSRPALEVVIVDDGSTDLYTRERLASLPYSRTRVLRTANRGLSAARNHGVRATTAEYLVTLDADDRLDPEYLSRTAGILDADPEIGFVSTAIRAFGAAHYTWTPPACTLTNWLVWGAGHPASMFRRSVWTAVGGFDESPAIQGRCEDRDFWISAMELGFRGEVIDEPLIEYRVRADSLHHSLVAGGGLHAAMAALFRKHRRTVESVGPDLLLEKVRFVEEQRSYQAALVDRRAMLERQREALEADIARVTAELARHGSPVLDWGEIGTRRPAAAADSADRSTSLQEFYAAAFLRAHAGDCRGTVLRVQPPGDRDLAPVHVTTGEPASRVTSVAEVSGLPADTFDCIVTGDALCTADDPLTSLLELRRVLKPGGVVLSVLPTVRATGDRVDDGDGRGFTEAAARHLFAKVFAAEAIQVVGYGNVMTCAAALAGVAADELEPAERDFVDPMFPVLYGVRAVKA